MNIATQAILRDIELAGRARSGPRWQPPAAGYFPVLALALVVGIPSRAEYDSSRDVALKKRHETCQKWLNRMVGESSQADPHAAARFGWLEKKSHLQGSVVFPTSKGVVELTLLVTHHFWDDVFLARVASSVSPTPLTYRGVLRGDELRLKATTTTPEGKRNSTLVIGARAGGPWTLTFAGALDQVGLDESSGVPLTFSHTGASPPRPADAGMEVPGPIESRPAACEVGARQLGDRLVGSWKGSHTLLATPHNDEGVYEATLTSRWVSGRRHVLSTWDFRLRTQRRRVPPAGELETLPRRLSSTSLLSYDCAAKRYSLYLVGLRDWGTMSFPDAPAIYEGSIAPSGVLVLAGAVRPSAQGRMANERLELELGLKKDLRIKRWSDSPTIGDSEVQAREVSVDQLEQAPVPQPN